MTIDVRELSQRIDEAFAHSQAGGEVVIVDGETPKAKLVPVAQPIPKKRTAGRHQGLIDLAPDFDAPLEEEFWGGRV